jgi:hypothetical protein
MDQAFSKLTPPGQEDDTVHGVMDLGILFQPPAVGANAIDNRTTAGKEIVSRNHWDHEISITVTRIL